MPRAIETLHARRAAQLKALAQVRNTLPAPDRAMVIDLFDRHGALTDKQLELVGVLAGRYLCEVV
jgi:hypothetical protein